MSHYLPSASWQTLQRRAELIARMRSFFHEQGFVEVETPILSADIILDAWLEPFVADYHSDPQRWSSRGRPRYLQTSPEAHMKRLLAAGATAIYQFSRVFRNGEHGTRHNPEFTMLEWYRLGDDHHQQMDFVENLVRTVLTAAHCFRRQPDSWESAQPFERLTYDDAFQQYAGQRILNLSTNELPALCHRHQLHPPASLESGDRDGWLNFLLAELVEPHLGRNRPTFLYDYPASQAALARVSERNGALVAERFELYLAGVELCNGYHELTDAAALRQRTQQQSELRAAAGLRPLPGPTQLLDAMHAGFPNCSGVALGVDRLVMLALGAQSIADVIAFPFDRA